MSELYCSDMMQFLGSHGASGEKPRVLPAGASRVQPASLSAHDAVTVQKTGAHLREHRSDLHVIWSSELARSNLHVMWNFQPAPAPALAPRGCTLALPATSAHLRPALMRSARRRPWRRVQRTAAPAQERSRQRPEPRGRCARPHQDGFRHRSEALQSHRPSRHNRRSCARG